MKKLILVILLTLFPCILHAATVPKQIEVSFEYPHNPPDLAGFRVYLENPDPTLEGILICGIAKDKTSGTCDMDIEVPDSGEQEVNLVFYMTAHDTAGNESLPSESFATVTTVDLPPEGQPKIININVKFVIKRPPLP